MLLNSHGFLANINLRVHKKKVILGVENLEKHK